jgi:hypothetical protein
MEGLSSSLMIVLLFVLRLGVPLLITLAIGYGLGRLDAKWQAEAEAERQAAAQAQAAAVQPQPRPAGLAAAAYQFPGRQPMPVGVMAGPPCYSLKGCSEAMQAACPATRQPAVPCWAARLGAEGQLPMECKGCQLYNPAVFDAKTMSWIGQDLIH